MRTISTSTQEFNTGGLRLDAGYYASSSVGAMRLLEHWKKMGKQREFHTLTSVCKTDGIFIPGRFRRIYVSNSKHGLPWLSPSDMLKADLTGIDYVSKKHTPIQDILRLQKGWLLLSRSGVIGNLGYVRSDMDGMIGSDDIIRIVPNEQKIPTGYLFAFLSSEVGKALIQQQTYGAVIQHIEAHHIKDLPIPRLDSTVEEHIHTLVEQAATLWVKRVQYLEQARQPFEYINNEEVLSYTPHSFDLSVIKGSDLGDRFGGYYHSIIYRNIENKIRSGNYKELKDLSEKIFVPPMFKHIYLNRPNQYPFITGGELVNRKISEIKYLSNKGVKNINDYIVKEGWIAVYRHGQFDSMLGSSFLIDKQLHEFCLSDLIIRVIIDKNIISPEYVFAFLSTKAGKLLIKRLATGRSIPFVTETSLSKIPIPILDNKIIDNVSKLVTAALDAQIASIQAEDEAKRILLNELSNI